MANRILFHTRLLSISASFCAELEMAFGRRSPGISVAVSQSPFGPAGLALIMEPPVLPVCLDEKEALCGPLYLPGKSVCPECLGHWLDMNLHGRADPERALSTEEARALACRVAAWSEAFARDGRVEELETAAVSLNFRDASSRRHPVFPRRDCPRCACLQIAANTPLRAHCSPWTGIVNSMELTSAPSAGAYRATSTWASPLPVSGARPYLRRQQSYGRGRTRLEAETSCIGEALERYSLIYRGDEPLIRARFSPADAIHPNDMQLFSESQYRERGAWNAIADEDFQVPDPFQPEAPVDWLEARRLGHKQGTKLVAAAGCLMWYQFRPGEPEFARADTIGCGGGPTFHQALTHALLEWIERDAMAIWWDNRLRRPAVRLESFESGELNEVAKGLRAIGRDLFLLDCTTDIGIPAYVSVAPRTDGSEPLIAGAADISARTAAYKAASEVGQVWYEAKRSGGASDSMRPWLLRETTATQPYLQPSGFIDAPRESEPPEDSAWRSIVERLEAVGLEAYAVDHSRPDVVSHTVRAIVPGLRHIWNRRAPGRLYDVPVKMGWLARAKGEADLNPTRCMI
ncbi:MAG: TOMM precursor leader peptide-binding protein [Bryobacteraceae bacterium]